jgi:formylglycine-generating enzyme required for sulfatase activity
LISWTDNSSNETGFEVSDGTTTRATTAAGATSATITGLTRGSSYTFQVRAVNSFGASGYASAASAYTVPVDYTIIFNANNGSGTAVTQTVASGSTTTLTANSFSYTNHSFGGWATTATSCKVYEDKGSVTLSSNLTLYAVWIYTAQTYASLSSSGDTSMLIVGSGTSSLSYSLATNEYTTALTTYLSPFVMGQYEVTYELWYTVRTWAANNGYTFGNSGREGNDGTVGAAPTAASCRQPVTTVSWRDCMVWCNAYTEWYNTQQGSSLKCVYYTDSNYTTPLRTSTTSTILTGTTAGSQDDPYIYAASTGNTSMSNCTASGFRLPTEVEWQYAASSAGAQAYNYVSGDSSASYSSSTVVGNYAWYYTNAYQVGSTSSDYGTHTVGTKTANGLGLYDMSGNVYEWCYDWYYPWSSSSTPYSGETNYVDSTYTSSYPYRVLRGGSWSYSAGSLEVGYRNFSNPYSADYAYFYYGFRVCQ